VDIELRHLRYFIALADAGSFTHAAERMFIAQATLSQQIRRLEAIVGTPLLQRRREGLRLTRAGTVLLDASRNTLSLLDHGVSSTRQAAGLGRPRLRVVVPAHLPEAPAVATAAALRLAAAAADVDVVWMETPLDAEFSLIRQHRADAGLGWLTSSPGALAGPLEVMSLGEFEPEVWIPSSHPAARRGSISLDQIVSMDVIHGPRRTDTATYDVWTRVLRATDPRFAFTDPPFRHSLSIALAFAATGDRPTAVLTGPSVMAGAGRQRRLVGQLTGRSGLGPLGLCRGQARLVDQPQEAEQLVRRCSTASIRVASTSPVCALTGTGRSAESSMITDRSRASASCSAMIWSCCSNTRPAPFGILQMFRSGTRGRG
jgi:DNA-binding transcriptional LysR family regulator